MSEPKCESCGVAWCDHLGPTGLCAALKEARQYVNELNNLLREVGWGQGEIDTAAVVAEENERLRAALAEVLKLLREVNENTLTYSEDDFGEEFECPGCWWCGGDGCAKNCPAQKAIKKAKQALNPPESEASD